MLRFAPRTFVFTLALAVAAVGLSLSTPAHAQSRGDGSVYSRFGIGELHTLSSSQSDALGGGGYALRSLNYNGFANPALWSDQILTRLEIGARYRTVNIEDGTGENSLLTAGSLAGVQFSFPLITQKLGLAVGFRPYSRSDYRVQRQDVLITGAPDPDTLAYDIDYEGRGGLQMIAGGLGYRINEALSVGARADFIFGIIENGRRTSFPEQTTLAPADVTDAVQLSGLTATLGAHLALADLFGDDALNVGVAFTLPTSLSGENRRTIDESLDRVTIGEEVDGSIDIPWQIRGGLAYQPDERWTIVADGSYAPWSTFESDFDAPVTGPGPSAFPAGGSDVLSDRWRMSFGAEWVPAGEDLREPFFSRVAYRLGAYTEKMYVSPVDGETLNEYALTGGLSLPTSVGGTRIDLNGTVGTRGTTDQSLVRDTFYGFAVFVSIGERWFLERKLR